MGSWYKKYEGKNCIGAVLAQMEDDGIPLHYIEEVIFTGDAKTCNYNNKLFASYVFDENNKCSITYELEQHKPRIIAAAVKPESGKIYTGRRHCDCIRKAVDEGGEPTPILGIHQGFVTNNGKYVDRKEAGKIAFECGQIKEPSDFLYSEDLW